MRVAADAGKTETLFFVMLIGFLQLYIHFKEKSSSLLTNGGVRHDDHDICVGGEDVNEGREVGVPYFHALERGCEFTGIKK